MEQPDDTRRGGRWTFLTNHARVLLEIARDPDIRLRDVALTSGITERAAQAIVADLEAAGYLTRARVGRRNRYTIDPNRRFRHPNESNFRIESLIALFADRDTPRAGRPPHEAETPRLGPPAAPPDRHDPQGRGMPGLGW